MMKKILPLLILPLLLLGCGGDVPPSSEVFLDKGMAMTKDNGVKSGLSYEDATIMFDQAVKQKPNNHAAWVKKGDIAMEYKKFDDAIESYSQALVYQPKDHNIYNKRGEAYVKIRQYDSAGKDFYQSLTINPKGVLAALNMCYMLSGLDRAKDAMPYCERVLLLEPKNPYATQLLERAKKQNLPSSSQ